MAGRVELQPLTDVEAVRYLLDKQVGTRFSFAWQDVREEEHVASFVVAKAMNSSILTDIHDELVIALTKGRTLEQFKADLKPRLQAKGWWGRQAQRDPVTGELQEVQLGSSRRLRTIYDVNMRMAHAAGRWERMQRVARPGDLVRYVAVMDGRTRPEHAAWHNLLLPIDHPFWKTHAPPNGWNCRCVCILVPASRVAREGLQATSDDELAGRGFGKTVTWSNPRTGRDEQIPAGIDPGFAYNVGLARLRAFTPSPAEAAAARSAPRAPGRQALFEQSKAALDDLPPPRPFTGRLLAEDISDEAAVKAFLDTFEGRLRTAAPGQFVFDDAAQVPLAISDGLFLDRMTGELKVAKRGRKPFLPVLAATILDPDEIWAAFEEIRDAQGKVVSRGWRRRYLARWTLPGTRQEAMLVVFEEDGDEWSGVSAYPPGVGTSPGKQARNMLAQGREGVRIYRRRE